MLHLLGLFLFGAGISMGAKQSGGKKPTTGNELISVNAQMFTACETKPAPLLSEKLAEQLNEEDLDSQLKVVGVGGALAFAGHFLYPPLSLLSLPVLGYSAWTMFKDAYKSVQARKLRISILDSISACVGIVLGYYVVAAIASILYFYSIKILNQTHSKTRKNLIDIFGGHPQQVWLLKDGVEISLPLEQIRKGDRIVINTGETIPIDGIIEEGIAQIDQHMLTGEAQPEEKLIGQQVFAMTLVISGRIIVRVEKTGVDTMAANITRMLAKTDDFISVLQIRSEHLANESVLPTFGLAGVAWFTRGPMGTMLALGSNFSEVMCVSVPLSMLNYLRIAANSGLLIKDGRSLEQLSKVDTVVFDKTGTLTLEQPHVGGIYPGAGFTEREVLYYTATAEYRQTHPIALAVLDAAAQQKIVLPLIDDAQYSIGYGIRVHLNGHQIRVGSARFMRRENIPLPEKFDAVELNAHEQGYSLIYTALDDVLCGVVELQPTVRPEAEAVIRRLRQRGLEVHIFSGDHNGPVKRLATQLGVDKYIAETLPEDKSRLIEELQQSGKTVCFVGDGINDAIALKKAAVSMSPRGASSFAMDSAQIILMRTDLRQIVETFELAEQFNFNQRVGIIAGTIAPSLISMGGILFFGLSISGSWVLYFAASVIGLASAMYPLLKNPIHTQSPQG
ncbi:Cation transport ATPase [Gammaproteobacteria bacterium]